MKRCFWSLVLILMTVSIGWAAYVGAQELESLVAVAPESDVPDTDRYQFMDHFFIQNGRQFEVFIKLDRQTGKTWRFHASNPRWIAIGEPTKMEETPQDLGVNRYELLSHVYHDQYQQDLELILLVDYTEGDSWKYRGMSTSWEVIPQEKQQPERPAPETSANAASASP